MHGTTLDQLDQLVRHQWLGAARYSQAACNAQGPWREVYRDLFQDNANRCLRCATRLGEVIGARGRVPTFECPSFAPTTDILSALRMGLEFETGAIRSALELICRADDDEDQEAQRVLAELLAQQRQSLGEIQSLLDDAERQAA